MCGGGGGGSAKPPRNTSQEKAAAEVAMQRYKRYMEVYRPMENVAIADVMGDQSANRVTRWAGGRLNADMAQSMAAGAPGGGADPSGQMPQMDMANTQRAAILANAAAEQTGLGRKQKLAGLDAAIGIGTGQAKQAQLGFNDLADQSLSRAIRQSEASFNSRADRMDTYGSAIGGAARIGEAMYDSKQSG